MAARRVRALGEFPRARHLRRRDERGHRRRGAPVVPSGIEAGADDCCVMCGRTLDFAAWLELLAASRDDRLDVAGAATSGVPDAAAPGASGFLGRRGDTG